MLNQNEKLERFAAQINRTAERSVQKIEKQTEKISNTALSSFREEEERDLESRKAYAKTRLERESNHALAALASSRKQEAAARREQIVDDVYAAAQEKLRAFTATTVYLELLRNCIQALTDALDSDDARIFVRKEDEAAAKEICTGLSCVKEVCVSDRIKLGLAFIENADGSIHLEDTFESRLESDRTRFLSTCGLSILPEKEDEA